LRVEVALLPEHIGDSESTMELVRNQVREYRHLIEEAMEDYGDVLGLETEDLEWAFGHVHSRSFGPDCALTPVVDLINHHAAAMPILGYLS